MKNLSIRELLRRYKADIVMLQESKKQKIDKPFRSFQGGRNKDWIFSPAEGSAGGMVTGWKADLFEVQAVEYGIFSLSVNLSIRESGFSCWLSCIYGLSTNRGKEEFQIELNDLVIWLMERGVLAGTSMRFSIQEIGKGVLAPLFRLLIILGFLNSP